MSRYVKAFLITLGFFVSLFIIAVAPLKLFLALIGMLVFGAVYSCVYMALEK